jgi:hypothetical protein
MRDHQMWVHHYHHHHLHLSLFRLRVQAFPLEQQICSLSSKVLSLISPPPAFLPSFLIDKTQKKGNKKNKNTKNTQKLLGVDLSLLLSPTHQNQNPNLALTERPQESYKCHCIWSMKPKYNNNNLFQLQTIHELNNKETKISVSGADEFWQD